MQITKDFLTARLAELEREKVQALANANACNGAISVTKALLLELEKPEPADKPAETPAAP